MLGGSTTAAETDRIWMLLLLMVVQLMVLRLMVLQLMVLYMPSGPVVTQNRLARQQQHAAETRHNKLNSIQQQLQAIRAEQHTITPLPSAQQQLHNVDLMSHTELSNTSSGCGSPYSIPTEEYSWSATDKAEAQEARAIVAAIMSSSQPIMQLQQQQHHPLQLQPVLQQHSAQQLNSPFQSSDASSVSEQSNPVQREHSVQWGQLQQPLQDLISHTRARAAGGAASVVLSVGGGIVLESGSSIS